MTEEVKKEEVQEQLFGALPKEYIDGVEYVMSYDENFTQFRFPLR